jgi:hypothetical protein
MLNRKAAPVHYDETSAREHRWVSVQQVTAPPFGGRDASSEIEYKIPIYVTAAIVRS